MGLGKGDEYLQGKTTVSVDSTGTAGAKAGAATEVGTYNTGTDRGGNKAGATREVREPREPKLAVSEFCTNTYVHLLARQSQQLTERQPVAEPGQVSNRRATGCLPAP